MNERLKELAFKAYNNAGQGTPEALSSFMEVYSEKFAKLIVKDIAKTVFKHLYNQDTVAEYNEYGWDCLPGDLRTMIEKHFGVTNE